MTIETSQKSSQMYNLITEDSYSLAVEFKIAYM